MAAVLKARIWPVPSAARSWVSSAATRADDRPAICAVDSCAIWSEVKAFSVSARSPASWIVLSACNCTAPSCWS